MAIYIPSHFGAARHDDAHRLMRERPFATLVTGAGGEPVITHLPLMFDPSPAPHGTLWGHVARPNPHWQKFGEGPTVAVFHGPHAYISPAWYERPAENVPTWNYAVVHAHGQPELLDAAEARTLLESLTSYFDPVPDTAVDSGKLNGLVNGIVAFRIALERVEVKLKMSQNKTAADRAGILRGLGASGDAEALATAGWMAARDGG